MFRPRGRQPRAKKLTDFVALDKEMCAVVAVKIIEIGVLETWIDGTKVFKAW